MALKVASFRMTGGLNADVLPALVPPDQWTGITNGVFRNGVATGVQGYAAYGGLMTVAAPRHVVAMNADESYLLGAAATAVYAAGEPLSAIVNYVIEQIIPSIPSHVAATPVAWAGVPPATTVGQWTGGIMNGVPFFNHPGYAPVDMRGGVPFTTLAGWGGGQVQALRAYREFYVALGVRAGALFDTDTVAWSARAAPNTTPAVWAPAAGNAAGSAIIPGGGDIVDAEPLGDVLMIYKRRAVWSMRYIGGNYIYDFQRQLQGIGALSQNCIATVGRQHVFLTEDDLVAWSGGGSPESLLSGKARRLLAGVIDETNYRNSFVVYLPRQREIWACFPPTGSTYAGTILVVDLTTGHVGKRTVSFIPHAVFLRERTAVGPGIYGQHALIYKNGASSTLALVDSGTLSVIGGTLPAGLERQGLDFGEPGRVKTVAWVRPWVKQGPSVFSLQCKAAGTMRPDEAPVYGASVPFTTGTSDKADLFAQGRFLHFAFTGTSGEAFSVPGFDVGYELGGAE